MKPVFSAWGVCSGVLECGQGLYVTTPIIMKFGGIAFRKSLKVRVEVCEFWCIVLRLATSLTSITVSIVVTLDTREFERPNLPWLQRCISYVNLQIA